MATFRALPPASEAVMGHHRFPLSGNIASTTRETKKPRMTDGPCEALSPQNERAVDLTLLLSCSRWSNVVEAGLNLTRDLADVASPGVIPEVVDG